MCHRGVFGEQLVTSGDEQGTGPLGGELTPLLEPSASSGARFERVTVSRSLVSSLHWDTLGRALGGPRSNLITLGLGQTS